MENFSIEHTTPDGRNDIAILTVHGEMDADSIQKVEAIVNPLLENSEVTYVVFDMTDLNYMNSRSVGLMMNFYGILKERSRNLILIGLQDGVQDTLSLVGVTQLVPTYKTYDEFLGAIAS